MSHGPSSAAIPQFPRLHSIQLPHVSWAGNETWRGGVKPQFRALIGQICALH